MKRALSIVAVLALVLSSFALVPSDRLELASASEESATDTAPILKTERETETVQKGNTCPRTDGDWTKIDAGSGNKAGDWGTLDWGGSTVTYAVTEGWSLQLCIKSGAKSGDAFDGWTSPWLTGSGEIVTGPDTGGSTEQDISHIAYQVTPPEPTQEPDLGELIVTKVVEGGQAPNGQTDYVLNVAGPGDYSEDVTLTVNGEGSDSETLTDLELGEYTVTEGDIPGSPDVTFDPADGKATVGADDDPTVSVTVTNDYGDDETEVESTWPLTVVKSVAGPIPDDDFAFTVDCGDFQLGDQNESFTIDAEGGQKLIGIGIPEDTECTVTETGDANAAETSVTVNDGDTVEAGTVTFDTIDEATTVTFLNTFSTAVTEVEPTAPLTVEKVVDGPAPDDNFDFSLDCDGFGVGSDATFSIDADGGTHTTGISIPEGTECTVVETGDAGAEETFVAVNGGQREAADHATFDTTDKVTTVTFRNTFAEDPDETTDPGEVTDPGETNDPDETEVKDKDVTPVGQDPTTDPDAPAKVADGDVTEVADKTLVAVEEEGALPTRIDAGGGGMATGQGPMGLTALVALMGGLFLALTRRSPRDQTV